MTLSTFSIFNDGLELFLFPKRWLVTSTRSRRASVGSASNNVERLDPYNGLLLSVGYDVEFENLLITFDQGGEIVLAPDFSSSEASSVGIQANARLRHVHARHLPYLEEHRNRFHKRVDQVK